MAVRREATTNCTFPQKWEGEWFLSGYQQSINIKGSQFSYRGKCTASEGNKYLIVDEKGCHRCLVIYEKHKNVLQYKESECDGDNLYYMDQSNPATLAIHSSSGIFNINSDINHNYNNDRVRGAHSNLKKLSSDHNINGSNDDVDDDSLNDSYCRSREQLQNLCDQIPGDALLYSLFRVEADPIKCPLRGPYTFTYNRGHGECKNPVSNINSCTEESRILFSFQACPDVQGTESSVEELTCLANWKDGNSRYLVGLVSHHHAISFEERYRCFVYEKVSPLMGAFLGTGTSFSNSNLKDAEYKLAQSGDATCNGLDSAEVGSRIMTLRKPQPAERCDFPTWFKIPRHWHALMGNSGYQYHLSDGSLHITKPNGYMETKAFCEQINKQTLTEMMAVVHYTSGCQSGFLCMMFYRRDKHIAEIQMGIPAVRLEDACAFDYFDTTKLPYVTLLASNPKPEICPLDGLYHLYGAIGPPYITSRHKRNHNNVNNNNNNNNNNNKNNYEEEHSNDNNKKNIKGHNQQHGHHHYNLTSTTVKDSEIKNKRKRFNIKSETSVTKAKALKTSILHIKSTKDPLKFDDALATIENNNKNIKRQRRDTQGCIVNYKSQRILRIGCIEPDRIDVRQQCGDDDDEVYFCHGSWIENGTIFIVAKHSGTQHGVCITYRQIDGVKSAKFIIGDACYRNSFMLKPPPDHHLIANITNFGKCGDPSSSNKIHNSFWLYALIFSTNLIQLWTSSAILINYR